MLARNVGNDLPYTSSQNFSFIKMRGACACMCMYVHVCMYTCMYVCMWMYVHVCMYVCMWMYVNVCACECECVEHGGAPFVAYVQSFKERLALVLAWQSVTSDKKYRHNLFKSMKRRLQQCINTGGEVVEWVVSACTCCCACRECMACNNTLDVCTFDGYLSATYSILTPKQQYLGLVH